MLYIVQCLTVMPTVAPPPTGGEGMKGRFRRGWQPYDLYSDRRRK